MYDFICTRLGGRWSVIVGTTVSTGSCYIQSIPFSIIRGKLLRQCKDNVSKVSNLSVYFIEALINTLSISIPLSV